MQTSGIPSMAALYMDQGKIAETTVAGKPEEARAAAEKFEALFIGQMLQHMFQGIGTDPLFGGGHGEEMFRSMMVDEYSKEMSKRGSFSLSDAIERQLLEMQEVE